MNTAREEMVSSLYWNLTDENSMIERDGSCLSLPSTIFFEFLTQIKTQIAFASQF